MHNGTKTLSITNGCVYVGGGSEEVGGGVRVF